VAGRKGPSWLATNEEEEEGLLQTTGESDRWPLNQMVSFEAEKGMSSMKGEGGQSGGVRGESKSRGYQRGKR